MISLALLQSDLARSILVLGRGSPVGIGKFEISGDKMSDKPSRYQNPPMSNEAWNEVEPNRFDLLLKLKKIAAENIEKDEDWSLNSFLKTMHDQMSKKTDSKPSRKQEKARRREEHERMVREAQERKRLKEGKNDR